MGYKRKYLILFVIIIALAAAVTGYYLYNKPAIDVLNASSGEAAAADLYKTFLKDTSSARKNYTHKVLEVSGEVSQISANQQRQLVILLKTNTEGAAINCTMEGAAGNIKAGNTVKIKGICNGMGESDAELGIMGDVYLVRCHITKAGI